MGDGGEQDVRGKISMKELFGRRNIKKDGTEGKVSPGWGGAVQNISCACCISSWPLLFLRNVSIFLFPTSPFAAGGAAAGARAAAGGGHSILLDQLLRL
jgi:hypothetical protein